MQRKNFIFGNSIVKINLFTFLISRIAGHKKSQEMPILRAFLALIYYSNSTITNQFCLEIIRCPVCISFDYLIYPYYPAYTG